jgi:origin recognition complex subunit 4
LGVKSIGASSARQPRNNPNLSSKPTIASQCICHIQLRRNTARISHRSSAAMSSPVPAVTRKRSRAYLEEDELSPEKDKSTTPLSGTKKRKLNTNGSSPGSGTIIGGIKRRIGGLLSWGGKGKENAKVDEDGDELANDANEEAEKDIWDVPDDDETRRSISRSRRNGSERTSALSTPNRKPTPVKSSNGRKANENATPTKSGSSKDIWEVPDEEISSARRSSRKAVSSVERAKATLAPVELEDNPVKRSPGRPKKSQILKEDKRLSKMAKRERLIAAQDTDGDEESMATPTKRRKAVRKGESLEESLQRSGGTSTRGRRGRPRKGSVDIVDAAQQVPKGILTPRKDRTLKSRKSVAFQDDGEVDLGFKDLPGSASAKTSERTSKLRREIAVEIPGAYDSRASGLEEPGNESENILFQEEDVESEDEEDEEDDDEICVVCSKPDFTKKNQILFCDSCDLGYHQACYNIEKLPKKNEDWFCRNCQPEQESGIMFDQLGNATALETLNNLPDIEGFEDHLRNMQRILLDKLTGQKRVKLQGHDEEMQKVYQVVEQTVLAGEGNSMLVIGARGSGKTTVSGSI